MAKWQRALLWCALAVYAQARLCQLFAGRLPSLLIVLLHVVPPAVFALAHGSLLYGRRGFVVFAGMCLGVGAVTESVSLLTGFPFGRYYFTDVMGPKLWGLPFLLVLAYLGIGYCAWVLAVLILGLRGRRLEGYRVVVLPVVASLMMLAWDLSMEADWSTVDRAWIWRDGGPYFGVPISNFGGWFLTAYLFYQGFALYCRRVGCQGNPDSGVFWRLPIVMYLVCAAGNLLVMALPMAPPLVTDATGRQWRTMEILAADAAVSALMMGTMALAAWVRLRNRETAAIAERGVERAISA
jgi:putative membrane protein